MIKIPLFFRIGVTRADLKHCGKIPDAREELNRSVREGRIESRHSIKCLEDMGSSSHDLRAEIRMHSFTVNCNTFSNEDKVAAVVPVTTYSMLMNIFKGHHVVALLVLHILF